MRVGGLCLLILLAPFFLFILFCWPLGMITLSFPIAIVCGTEYFSFSFTRKGEYILVFCISCFATYGGLLVLRSTGLGILLSLKLAGEILFCEENLPYVTAFGVLAYYLWSSYGSFTKRYKKLAWALCNHYEKQTGIDRVKSSPYLLKKIPKTLFDKSCQDTFPIKENVYKLIWKVLYLTFFGAVLFFTMLLDATCLTRTLVVAFTGAVPKIITFFVEKRKSLRNEDMTIDEKALQLVQQYSAESTPKLNEKNVMSYYDLDLAPLRSDDFVTSLGINFMPLSFLVISAYFCFDLFSVSSW